MSNIQFKFVQLTSDLIPNIVVDKRNEIVQYGLDNQFPQHLLNLSVQSSLHTAILDRKIKLGIGEGVSYDGPTNSKTDAFIAEPNPYEDMNSILEKCYTDTEIFGGFGLQVVWAKDKKNIAQIYHVPFQNIRSGKINKLNLVEDYYYFDEWKKYTRLADAEKFIAFNKVIPTGKQMLYAKKYSATNLYYPLPGYVGGLNDINTLYEISVFHNACITNNFAPGIMIIFRGPRPTEDEQNQIMKMLTAKYSGAKNAGTPSVFFLDNEQQAPQIEQTQVTDLDKQYSTLTEAVKESVVMAHSIPRIIAGLEKSGSLGGGKEYVDASEVFKNDYVSKNQAFVLRYLNRIMDVNKLKPLTIINSSPSLMLYDANLLTQVLTKNEVREMFGYEPLEEDTTTGEQVNDVGDVVVEEEPVVDETTETGEKIITE